LIYENVCMITTLPSKRISAICEKNICQSYTHKIAAKAS